MGRGLPQHLANKELCNFLAASRSLHSACGRTDNSRLSANVGYVLAHQADHKAHRLLRDAEAHNQDPRERLYETLQVSPSTCSCRILFRGDKHIKFETRSSAKEETHIMATKLMQCFEPKDIEWNTAFYSVRNNYEFDEGLVVHKDVSVTYDAKNPIASLSYSQDKILLNAISFQDVINKKERIIDLEKASPWKPLTRCIAIQTKKRLRSDEDRALELEMKCRKTADLEWVVGRGVSEHLANKELCNVLAASRSLHSACGLTATSRFSANVGYALAHQSDPKAHRLLRHAERQQQVWFQWP